jgi:hypothetical protein
MLENEWELKEGSRLTTDTDAKRFAIFAVEQMLRDKEIQGRDINEVLARAAFIERAFYELAIKDRLVCEPLEEEERIKDEFPHTYRDKEDGKIKTVDCKPSYALILNLEPTAYRSKCIDSSTERLYRVTRGELLSLRRDRRTAEAYHCDESV